MVWYVKLDRLRGPNVICIHNDQGLVNQDGLELEIISQKKLFQSMGFIEIINVRCYIHKNQNPNPSWRYFRLRKNKFGPINREFEKGTQAVINYGTINKRSNS